MIINNKYMATNLRPSVNMRVGTQVLPRVSIVWLNHRKCDDKNVFGSFMEIIATLPLILFIHTE